MYTYVLVFPLGESALSTSDPTYQAKKFRRMVKTLEDISHKKVK